MTQSSQPQMIELKPGPAMERAISRAKAERLKVKLVNVTERIYSVVSGENAYTVRFAVASGKKFCYCDCRAGQQGMLCKHAVVAAQANVMAQSVKQVAERSATSH